MMKSSSMMRAMLGMAAALGVPAAEMPSMPPMLSMIPPAQPIVNRRPAGAHKAAHRAALKARRVRAHRARA